MGAFAAGQVIVVPFPFSDLSGKKFRPALILADAGRGDWVLCQITSNSFADPDAIELNESAFTQGGLQRTSYARPSKLFTANDSLFVAQAGVLKTFNFERVRDAIIAMLLGEKA
jgi:mRNA interferase MazF